MKLREVLVAGLVLLMAGCRLFEPKFELPIFNLGSSKTDTVEIEETKQTELYRLAQELAAAVVERNPEAILAQIDDEAGALVDAKAERTKVEIARILSDEKSTLYAILFNSRRIADIYGDDEVKSYREYLGRAEKVSIELYFYNEEECEVRFDFENRPSAAVFGNPIYQKIGDRWALRRIF